MTDSTNVNIFQKLSKNSQNISLQSISMSGIYRTDWNIGLRI